MTLSSEKMMQLMAYADGELEGAERAEIEKLVASDADAARFVEQVAGLGDFVKDGHEHRDAETVRSFDVADAIMAKTKSSADVVSMAAARQRRVIALGVAAALGLAASVFLLARPSEAPLQGGAVAVGTQKPAPSEGPGVEVTPVESPGQTVNVFYVPSGNELSTSVVVWVDETGEK